MSKPKRVGIYARVSTSDQTVENQLLDLRRFAKEQGWVIAKEFSDCGISGAKSSRPGLDKLMDAARKKRFDVLLVWRFDRFARSVKHLVLTLEELQGLGIAFCSYQKTLIPAPPWVKRSSRSSLAMAALERNIIIERVHAGLRRAKANGKRLAAPSLRSTQGGCWNCGGKGRRCGRSQRP